MRYVIVSIFFLLLFCGCGRNDSPVSVKSVKTVEGCGRIISTAPSITETLFELGLGNQVVGVTDNCEYPAEAEKKPRIGQVLNINLESVMSLKPDTVFVISANENLADKFKSLNIKTSVVDNSTVNGFLKSLDEIGEKCNVREKAAQLKSSIEKNMKEIPTSEKKKVMVIAGRDYFSNKIKDVYIAGNDGFYDELIKMTGSVNIYHGKLNYPKIQLEGIISLNPDVIFDVITMSDLCEKNRERFLKSWSDLSDVNAVKNGKVFVICKNYWSIPGPRFINIAKDISEMMKQ